MAVKTQQSLSGFIRGDMELRKTSDGRPMFLAKAGQNQFEHVGQGKFNQLENQYIPIVQFGKAATKTFENYRPGDRFVAEGYLHDRTFKDKEGVEQTEQQFIVKKIGHDTAWTNYDVHRKEPELAVEQEAVSQELSQEQSSPEMEHDAAGVEKGTLDAEQGSLGQEYDPSGLEQGEPDMEPSHIEPTRRLPTVSGSGMTRQQEPAGAGAPSPI